MRVGLFGGTFNPIHLGHLRAAEEVREAIQLDLVYFIPAASPPHKAKSELAPAEHRLAMVRLATKGNRHFMATLRQPATLYLLMGADQFAELESWKEPDELARLCNFAVHTRLTEGESGPPRISVAALKRFGYTQADDHYVHSSGQTLSFVETTFLPISATEIRGKLQHGESIRYLVPIDVVDYIQRHALY